MNIEVLEIENNKENSIFCGTLHYENKDLEDNHLSHYSMDIQEKHMKDYVKQFHDLPVICTCNRCLKGILMGEGKGIYLLDLVMM